MPNHREDRISRLPHQDATRSTAQVDRDRVLYSLAFRRLAGVTQVISPGEGEIFHNRLTHSLKVAQIARRFAEHFVHKYKTEVDEWGGLDPEVVEAAALVHDLGHPPFGHIAEVKLDLLINEHLKEESCPSAEGFEGNAQSFRIVTNLSVRRPDSRFGLDLSRATLNASLKYPWMKGENAEQTKKYGVYRSDIEAFKFAREHMTVPASLKDHLHIRSLEAQIMDWADDIAYSVHDTEDFYRAGLIPLDRLAANPDEQNKFRDDIFNKASLTSGSTEYDTHERVFRGIIKEIGVREPYQGSKSQQEQLYNFMSNRIDKFVRATTLKKPSNGEAIDVEKDVFLEVRFLKRLIWIYVIENPSMASHQRGQCKAIETLYNEFREAFKKGNLALFPEFFRERARKLLENRSSVTKDEFTLSTIRLLSDTIGSMTDRQALLIYRQLAGVSPSSMINSIL